MESFSDIACHTNNTAVLLLVHTAKRTKIINLQTQCTLPLPTICLRLTGNFQGSYNFLNLVSGLVIKRRAFHELPAPDSVIDCVTALAATSGVSSHLILLIDTEFLSHGPTMM